MAKRQQTLFLLILITAAVARLGWPGLTEFKADEARLLKLAFDMAEGGGLALRGIGSSVGFPNFPMSVWLYALPSWLWLHPYAATIFTGLLNTLAVAGCFWLVRRYWGTETALLAMLLLAVSPWAILYSRKIWAQNLLPLFVLGWGAGAMLAFVEGRRRFLWLHLLCLAIVVQIHLAAVGLVVATAVFLIIFRRRVAWRDLLVGGGLGLLTAVPFIIYLAQDGFFDRLLNRSSLPDTGAAAANTWTASFRFVWLLSTGREIHSLAGPVAFQDYLARVPDLAAVHIGWSLLMVLGVGVVVAEARRRWVEPAAQAGIIVLIWLLLPPIFFAFWRSSPIFLHYFIATLPAQFVLIAIGAGWLLRQEWLQAGTKTAVWGGLVLAAALQLYSWAALLQFVANHPTPGGFSNELAAQLDQADTARTLLANANASEILLVGRGENPEAESFPAIFGTLLYGVPHRFVDGERSALFPAKTAVVLLENPVSLYEPFAAGATVFVLPAGSAPAPAQLVEPVPIWTNWVSLAGYTLVDKTADSAIWQLYWHTGGNPDPASYHFFNHLLDASGQQLAQADAALFAPSQWQAGDVVVSRFTLPWSDAATTMRVGIYRYPSLENVPIFDVAGNPSAPALELPVVSGQ